MHVVIMGCGRVGATLAAQLDRLGHSVTIVDQDESSLRRLPGDFRGRTVRGVGYTADG